MWIALGIIVFVLLVGVLIYNGLVRLNVRVDEAWSDITVQLKRRADLIPNLINTVKGYAAHEKDTLTAVIEARAKATAVTFNADQLTEANMKKFQQAQAGVSSALSRLMVSVEKYPELKANENFRDLQSQLEGTENRITVARNRYIEAIKEFNNLITVPPTSFYNGIFLHLAKKPQFQVENIEEAQKAPAVKF